MTEMPKRGLGLVLRQSREARGLSRRDLAEAAGLSYPYMSELENGAKYPSESAIANLAAALDVEPTELERKAENFELSNTRIVNNVSVIHSSSGLDSSFEDGLVNEVLSQIEPAIRSAIRVALKGES